MKKQLFSLALMFSLLTVNTFAGKVEGGGYGEEGTLDLAGEGAEHTTDRGGSANIALNDRGGTNTAAGRFVARGRGAAVAAGGRQTSGKIANKGR